jgi:hypothetical protein
MGCVVDPSLSPLIPYHPRLFPPLPGRKEELTAVFGRVFCVAQYQPICLVRAWGADELLDLNRSSVAWC